MPVTDGMPTPWPLPTKTQQIRATNQAVAAGNKAIQESSAGGQSLVTSAEFTHQIRRGIASLTRKAVVFAGLLRDIGDSVVALFEALHAAGNAFARHHIIVLENDSKDGETRTLLSQHCSTKQTWCFELDLPWFGMPQSHEKRGRVLFLTKLREALLQQVRNFVTVSTEHWDYLVNFDGDIFASGSLGFNPPAFLAMFGLSRDGHEHAFDVTCANQVTEFETQIPGRFRDTFALRKKSWDEWQPWCCTAGRYASSTTGKHGPRGSRAIAISGPWGRGATF